MKYCPACATTYEDEITVCEVDGVTLKVGEKQDPYLGKIIKGRYRILSKLGQGGMGAVYLAEQLSVARKVALKLLQGSYAIDDEFIARFRREARLAASLNHRNIVVLYDFDQADDGSLFIAMEYLNGERLTDVIHREAPLDITRASRLGIQISDGLNAAHHAGVIHRDIKPDNIMVLGHGASEEIKLMDFGIARLRDTGTSHITRAGLIMGTPAYMAPEQAEGAEVSEKTDIYALGVVLYEMLGGTAPFSAATPGAVLMKQIRERPLALRKLRGEVPVSLERIVMQALEKEPAKRQHNVGEVAEQLRKAEERLKTDPGARSWSPRAWNLIGRGVRKPTEGKGSAIERMMAPPPTVVQNDEPILGTQIALEEAPKTLLATEEIFRSNTGIARTPVSPLKWVTLGVVGLTCALAIVYYLTIPKAVSVAVETPKKALTPTEQIKLVANVTFSDGTIQEVAKGLEWRSTDHSIVRITPDGQAEGLAEGSAELYAKYQGLETPPIKVVVKALKPPPIAPKLVSVNVVSPKRHLEANEQIALRLLAESSDGGKRDVVNGVTWTSSDLHVAFIDSKGNVLARNSGTVQITAFYDGLSSSPITFTVKDKIATPLQRPPGTDSTAGLRRANDYYENGRYIEAINELERILKNNPQNGQALVLRGKVLNACRKEGMCG